MRSMPTEQALSILDQAQAMGFRGLVSFHEVSEPFLDPRIIEMAWAVKKRGMRPYEHTNGDVLRRNADLAKAAAEVFEYMVIGLYDYENAAELEAEKRFWRERLKGTKVSFRLVGKVVPRLFTPFDERMSIEKKSYPHGVCTQPVMRLIVHYDGEVALCCQDMIDDFGLGNAFETPIREIWYSEKHIQIIKDLEKGLRTNYALCTKCAEPPPLKLSLPTRIVRKLNRLVTSTR
ncbi:MAG: SPASM domain-containing protein [Caldilineaceae bacterium]|nr:SPASM domain-containing protein [Caldilineaceae bacterium]